MLRMQGYSGRLMVGYMESVRFRGWSLTCDRSALNQTYWELSATVANADSFWSTQPPTALWLVVDVDSWWRWNTVSIVSGAVVIHKPIKLAFVGNPEIGRN